VAWGDGDKTMAEKKEVIGLAVMKAIITTAIIGFAINRMDIVLTTTDLFTKVFTSGMIGIVCILGTVLYSFNLSKIGFLKTTKQFFYTPGISWGDNVEHLVRSWLESGMIAAMLGVSYLISGESDWGVYPVLVFLGFGSLFAYIFRNDCKQTMDYLRYFMYGYFFGIGMVLTGVLITFLVTIFGAFWVGLLITIDAVFTGAYTYLDLLDWEKEQNKNITEAKIEAGLV
jgi:hypothetical protein